MIEKVSFCGFSILNASPQQCVQYFKIILNTPYFYHILTLNPEIISQSQNDVELKKQLQTSCLCTADGIGLRLAIRWINRQTVEKCTGLDLVDYVFKSNAFSVYLVGATPQSLNKSIDAIKRRFPKLEIKGYHHGYFDQSEEQEIIQDIQLKEPDIVIAGMGFPRQDQFLRACASSLSRGVGMGVGGVIDIYSSEKKRVPQWIRKCGMEWFVQGLLDANRIKRWVPMVIGFTKVLIANRLMTLPFQRK